MQPKRKALMILSILLLNTMLCLASPRSAVKEDDLKTSLEKRTQLDEGEQQDEEMMEKQFQFDVEAEEEDLEVVCINKYLS